MFKSNEMVHKVANEGHILNRLVSSYLQKDVNRAKQEMLAAGTLSS